MQSAVEKTALGRGPQLFLIEDLTGSGKTEAAIVLTHRLMAEGNATGLYFALPTMATANAMFDRISSMYKGLFPEGASPSLVLAHSAPYIRELRSLLVPERQSHEVYAPDEPSISSEANSWLADNRKKALLAQVGIGTVDQALLAVLQVRHNSLRLLGLHRHVLIVDEVHAYDTYMTSLLERLLEFHAALGGSAILMSATLPLRLRERLIAAFGRGCNSESASPSATNYPLLTAVDASRTQEVGVPARQGTSRHLRTVLLNDEQAVIQSIGSAVNAGRCVCWIRNSVQDAIETYGKLRESLPADRLVLFHARFAMGDRIKIEERILRDFGPRSTQDQRRGKVVVATQVVEQSLDLDFDELVTDLAPIDLIIQRAGRLHRHARPSRGEPTLHVFSPEWNEAPDGKWVSSALPRTALVYPDHGQLWLTMRVLRERGAIELPKDAREVVESVFGADAGTRVPAGLNPSTVRADTRDRIDRSIASANDVRLETGFVSTGTDWLPEARVSTRLGEPVSTIRLARWNGIRLVPYFEAARRAWELSQVTVARWRLSTRAPGHDEAICEAEASMPFVDEGTVTIALREATDGWVGEGRNVQGHQVEVLYGRATGLQVRRSA